MACAGCKRLGPGGDETPDQVTKTASKACSPERLRTSRMDSCRQRTFSQLHTAILADRVGVRSTFGDLTSRDAMFRLCRNANPRATSMATCRPLHHCIAQNSRAQEFRVLDTASRASTKGRCQALLKPGLRHRYSFMLSLNGIARQRVPSAAVAINTKKQDVKDPGSGS